LRAACSCEFEQDQTRMSNRRAKRERHDIRSRGRLRYLLAVLDLEDLQRVGVVPKEFSSKPNATAIERMLDERLATFRKADSRLRKRPVTRGVSPVASVWKEMQSKFPGVIVDELIVDELHDVSSGSIT
jgi:hypothetical protein